ncbi:MAG: ATP-binding protein [Elusimicrobiales bacterium]
MTDTELNKKLNELLSRHETECLEFKEAANDFSFEKLGEYFSALSNEANLAGCPNSWLVLGIEDRTRSIVGTSFKKGKLTALPNDFSVHTTGNICFQPFELTRDGKRVILLKIPAAPQGIPIAWQGHYYARHGASLVALDINKLETIRRQIMPDWSARVIEEASIDMLDKDAIAFAREQFLPGNPEAAEWDTRTFLNKAKLTIRDKITNTAILLLGASESEHFLSPAMAKITWVSKEQNSLNSDQYEHFHPPFLLNTDKILALIRNPNFQYLPDATLFPLEIRKYDNWIIREALHNCIAHQDYLMGGRINVVEYPDKLVFSNLGAFIPGNIEAVLRENAPQIKYRNPFLAQAMVNLKMIETIGSGIPKMFQIQRNRFFPLPHYELKESSVQLTVDGNILDPRFSQLLRRNPELDLPTVLTLDKVQRRLSIPIDEAKKLKKKGLIEGRYPNIFISDTISAIMEQKAQYFRNRAFDNRYYEDMILEFVKKHKVASRRDINDLLFEKLPEFMTDNKKQQKISNILTAMRKKNAIINIGTDRHSEWVPGAN